MDVQRIFLLSPASCHGRRATILLNPAATFDMACKMRSPGGASLAEAFSFLSGLYFRGKVAYARSFARPPKDTPGILTISTDRGLLPIDTPITCDDLRAFAEVPIDLAEPRYREPLERDVRQLADTLPHDCEVVLLGSIATGKYVDVLLSFLNGRLLFPIDFVGRGDMSRGGLLLRAAADDQELAYTPVAGAVRHGQRPARLPRRT